MARIGYARVSTIDQNFDSQLARLKAEGCEIVRSQEMSDASRGGRAELATVIEFPRSGMSWRLPDRTGTAASVATPAMSST